MWFLTFCRLAWRTRLEVDVVLKALQLQERWRHPGPDTTSAIDYGHSRKSRGGLRR